MQTKEKTMTDTDKRSAEQADDVAKRTSTKTYTVICAQNVPHYGSVEIDAIDDTEALAAAKAYDLSDVACDPDWKNSTCKRIVTIEDEAGNVVAEDVALDNWFLYHAPIDTVLCEAAPGFLAALRTIAAIPLWGEPISDPGVKAELILSAEYDAELEEFNPSADTESSYLRDAVEHARAAILLFPQERLNQHEQVATS
jgi:hypothetical protein